MNDERRINAEGELRKNEKNLICVTGRLINKI
jgi:hypothetical protein